VFRSVHGSLPDDGFIRSPGYGGTYLANWPLRLSVTATSMKLPHALDGPAPGVGRILPFRVRGVHVRSWPTAAYRRPTVHVSLRSFSGHAPPPAGPAAHDPEENVRFGEKTWERHDKH
jgi:hypothetical protein